MSDASISERPVAEAPALTDRQVADYLQRQPQFFIRQPTLLNSLQIPHYSRGAMSLVELQLLSLRQQVSDLQQQQRELLARAAENERLFFSLLPLQRQLLQAPTLADGLQALQQWSRAQGLLACGLRLFSDSWQLTAPSTAGTDFGRRTAGAAAMEPRAPHPVTAIAARRHSRAPSNWPPGRNIGQSAARGLAQTAADSMPAHEPCSAQLAASCH